MPVRPTSRATSFHPRRRCASKSPGCAAPPRRSSNGEPPQSWVQRRRMGRPLSRSRQVHRTPAEKRLLSEAKKKRANSLCRPLMLRTHTKRQELRYGRVAAGESLGADAEATTVEKRAAVREEALNFQIPYSRVLEGMEDRLCFSRPRRSHTINESELQELDDVGLTRTM